MWYWILDVATVTIAAQLDAGTGSTINNMFK
jgi:hypothetical protein